MALEVILLQTQRSTVRRFSDAVRKAEDRARQRDSDNPVTSALSAISDAGFAVYKPQSRRSNIKHVQFIQSNWDWLNNLPKTDRQRLTTAERSFLIQLVPLVHYGTNSICKKIISGYDPLNISQIADILNLDRKFANKLINSLVKKGVMAYSVAGSDVNYSADDPNSKLINNKIWHVNPRLMYSGKAREINETLRVIFANSLTKAPVKMF
jgi:hypothetical protein